MAKANQEFIDLYLEGDPTRVEDFAKTLSPKSPDRKACLALAECLLLRNGRREFEKTHELLRAALDDRPSDPELVALLLKECVFLAMDTDRKNEAAQAMRFLTRLDRKLLRPEVDAHIHLLQSYYYDGIFENESQQRALDKVLELDLPVTSAAYFLACYNRLVLHVRRLEIKEAESFRERIDRCAERTGRESILCASRELGALIGRVTGKYEEALRQYSAIEERVAHSYRIRVLSEKARLLFRMQRIAEADALLNDLTRDTESEEFRALRLGGVMLPLLDYTRVVRMLALRDLRGARARLRDILPKTRATRYLCYTLHLLCEVELADANPRAARMILEMIDRDEQTAGLHAYWARLYWLDGNREKAARHFRHLLDKGMPGLIKDQMLFAYELSAGDLLSLTELAIDLDVNRPSDVAPGGSDAAPRPADAVEFVGVSEHARKIRELITQYAAHDRTVLITGATGTGKEVVAKLLHGLGGRAKHPFVAVNCGSLQDALIESELFGHVRGAFTGAIKSHGGMFLAAGKGTVFLDEVNSMSPRLQAALLRTLETHVIRPVGSSRTVPIHARVIAATNRSLDELVAEGAFRPDLYYRLAKLHIRIPPLVERPEDIPHLMRHFLDRLPRGREIEISDELIARFRANPWPGNVRELGNEIERLVLVSGASDRLEADASDDRRVTERNFRTTQRPLGTPPDGTPEVPAAGGTEGDGQSYREMRLRKIRALFNARERVTRADVVKEIGCAPKTAAGDLLALVRAGVIRRVHTSAHIRTSYFTRT